MQNTTSRAFKGPPSVWFWCKLKQIFVKDEINYFISYGVAFIQTRSMDIGNWIIFFITEEDAHLIKVGAFIWVTLLDMMIILVCNLPKFCKLSNHELYIYLPLETHQNFVMKPTGNYLYIIKRRTRREEQPLRRATPLSWELMRISCCDSLNSAPTIKIKPPHFHYSAFSLCS